ncbi:hypothetical protein [Bradyrhizobium sp. LTSP857]|uniref:hypothetical protein n=1 Tax=Bradyrhizobium sp. LTSP857 TaxID=1619231 RepID=UPI0005D179BE|nr:hypothetical protein [Bradyrhizobium sp. LTSP857]KJC36496.1 hypothetical protein UP06_32830 [Bradyrhizobium sp. LTSP857]
MVAVTSGHQRLARERYLDVPSVRLCVLGGDASFGAVLAFCAVAAGSCFCVVENVRSKHSRIASSDVASMQLSPARAQVDENAKQMAAEINKVRIVEILCALQRISF